MIGNVIILLISWALLYWLRKEDLRILGPFPVSGRLKEFLLGFLFLNLVYVLILALEWGVYDISWSLKNDASIVDYFRTLWYYFKSALFEDLLFRGALLYLLWQYIKPGWAILISAVAFGIYHWFSYGMLGGPIVPMIYVFIATGFMGYSWGYTYYKTKSILPALGMHLGWNATAEIFWGSGLDNALFNLSRVTPQSESVELTISLIKALLPPMLIIIAVNLYTKKRTVTP